MTSKYNYLEIARELFELIDSTSEGEDMLPVYRLAQSLRQLLADNFDGVGNELVIWAGLKHDTPEMAKGYSEGIIEAYPELKR